MGWLPIAVAAAAAYLFYQASSQVLMWIALAAGAVSFWSFGVMHNYAVEATRSRTSYRGGSDFSTSEADSAPDVVTLINLGAAIFIAVLMITAVIKSF